MKQALILTAAAVTSLVVGCGETDQRMTVENTNRHDAASWEGAKNAYVAKGWTQGNKGSWENHIRARGQLQNEYGKTN